MFRINISLVLAFIISPILALQTASAAMPVPNGQQFYQYDPVVSPAQNDDASLAKPMGVGTVAAGGDSLSVLINTGLFSGPVDLYLGLYVPAIDPQNIYLITDTGFHQVSQGLVPWKRGVTSANQDIFGQIPISTLPQGPYTFYFLATPAGRLDGYYLWVTAITVPEVKQTVGSDGGTLTVGNSASSIMGASVSVPVGVLTNNTPVSIGVSGSCPAFPSAAATSCIDFGPSGTVFDMPATITIPYDPKTTQDENNLLVYGYDTTSGAWVAARTVNVDAVNHLVTAQTGHFSSYTAQDQKTKVAVNLYQNSKTSELSASAVITTPFKNVKLPPTLTFCTNDETYTSMADLLLGRAPEVTFEYIAKLMKYNRWSFLDTPVATKVITYKELDTDCKLTHCAVSVSDGKTYWFGSGTNTIGDVADWYTGAPALFRFGVKPEKDAEYYVILELDVHGCYGLGIYNFDGQKERTSSFLSQKNVDTDEDGITNGYDRKTPDISAPSQITGLTLNAVSSTQINLSWNRATDNVAVTGYRIYRKTGAFSSPSLDPDTFYWQTRNDTPNYSNTHLNPATHYCYRVTAVDAAKNESTYAEGCSTTPATPDTTPPSAPTGLSASCNSRSQIDLSWNASTDNVGVKGYKIYRTGNFIKSANSTGIADYGLQAGTEYCYQVSAYDEAGNESSKSSEICKKTLADPDKTPPSVPTGLTATAISEHQITLSWAASTDNVAVAGYRIYNGATLIQTVTATTTSMSGLTPGMQYCYKVAAIDTSNNLSAQSSEVCSTTQRIVDTQAPSIPARLSVTAVSPYRIDLSWNVSTDNAGVAGYNVYRNGSLRQPVIGTWISDTTLSPSAQYCYQITAYDAANNESAKSAQACATTQAATQIPVPVGPHWFSYSQVAAPSVNIDPAQAMPLGFGSDPAAMRAVVNTAPFAGPVDSYVLLKNLTTQGLLVLENPAGTCGCNGDVIDCVKGWESVSGGYSCSNEFNTAGPISNSSLIASPWLPVGYKVYFVVAPFLTDDQRTALRLGSRGFQDYYVWEVLYQGSPQAACTYTYSDWEACKPDGMQTRTVISSSPDGCTGTPVLTQPCTFVPPTCTDWTYSDWSACSNGTQTRTVTGTMPEGCTGTPLPEPVTSQACSMTPLPSGMVSVPGGWFLMGDTFNVGYPEEQPVHKVYLSAFSIDKYEVTQAEYQAVIGTNPSSFNSCGGNCPVEQVTWFDADYYCKKVGKRLPSEAEWEYASRSGGQNHKYAGTSSDADIGNYAWYAFNSNNTTNPVGQKLPNGLGIYDMSGNVVEWVADWYEAYSASDQYNPTGPAAGSLRVIRGGGWGDAPDGVRASIRVGFSPNGRHIVLGFRCASNSATTIPPACSYTYSDWGACQPDNTQTRTVLSISPNGCTGTPILSQQCTYVPPVQCSYTLSPSSFAVPSSGGSYSFSIVSSATSGCSYWMASSSEGWISVTASGTGNGSVNYKVAANTTTSPRKATISVAGQTVTVLQVGAQTGSQPCTDYIYSGWGPCTNGQQQRSVIGYAPSACSGTPTTAPVTAQTCSITPPVSCTYTLNPTYNTSVPSAG